MSDVVRIVHISDPHLAAGFPFHSSYLTNKRIVGYLNLVLKRRKQHKRRLAFAMWDAVQALEPDILLVTGDFTNIALEAEFDLALQWIRGFGLPPERVMVLPGNHDAYIGRVWKDAVFARAFQQYLPKDVRERWPWDSFPMVQRIGPVTIVGLSSSVPCPPFLAWGRLGGGQISRLRRILEREKGSFRVLALHHPVHVGATRWDNALLDADALRATLQDVGAELVLTGHLHRPFVESIMGPGGVAVPVLGVGSASLDHETKRKRAQFRVLDVAPAGRSWTLHQELWVHGVDMGGYHAFESTDVCLGQVEWISSMGVTGSKPES